MWSNPKFLFLGIRFVSSLWEESQHHAFKWSVSQSHQLTQLQIVEFCGTTSPCRFGASTLSECKRFESLPVSSCSVHVCQSTAKHLVAFQGQKLVHLVQLLLDRQRAAHHGGCSPDSAGVGHSEILTSADRAFASTSSYGCALA